MKKLHVKATFIEPVLGTWPANPNVAREFIASKSPDAATIEDEVAALGPDAVADKGMSPTYVRKLNALDIIADSKDKKLMSAFINATKKLAAAHSVRMDRLNELPAVEEQPEQTAFDRTCAPAGKLIDTREAAIRDKEDTHE